jgi:hypothetical protein
MPKKILVTDADSYDLMSVLEQFESVGERTIVHPTDEPWPDIGRSDVMRLARDVHQADGR